MKGFTKDRYQIRKTTWYCAWRRCCSLRSPNEYLKKDLGSETPFHLARFFPHYKSSDHNIFNATPVTSLYQAYETAIETGLKYIYLGNVSSRKYESTYCFNCNELIIERDGYSIRKIGLDDLGNCKKCGFRILINL